MLSYKEYKLLNESLYGAFNLGLKGHSTVGGIVSDSSVNGTEAALEAESEEAIEEAKKGKKMKKKMFGDEEEVVKKVKVSDEDHDEDDDDDKDDHDEDEDSEDDHDDEDKEDHDEDEDSEDEDSDEEKSDSKGREFAFMKKKSKKHMKKKSKKEWSEVMSDLEDILEAIDDEEALLEVKKGLQMMKKGMQKGVDGAKAANDPKNQIDKSIEYHGNRNMKKHMGCGTKKCGKYMNEEEQAWWQSVNGMLNADPDQKHWDGGWKEVGEVEQAVRDGNQIDEGILQDLGNSKFVRNAVTAAGLGAAALGGYGLRGMQSKGGVDASSGRAVAAQQADASERGLEGWQDEVLTFFKHLSPVERTEMILRDYKGQVPDFLKNQGLEFYKGQLGHGELEQIDYFKRVGQKERMEAVKDVMGGKVPDYLAQYFGKNLDRTKPAWGWPVSEFGR